VLVVGGPDVATYAGKRMKVIGIKKKEWNQQKKRIEHVGHRVTYLKSEKYESRRDQVLD
jgi:hypothetical protein